MKRLNQRGDSLIEVTLGLTILGATLVSSLAIANRATRLGEAARQRAAAASIAQGQMEALRNYRDNNSWSTVYRALNHKRVWMANSGGWTPQPGTGVGVYASLPGSRITILGSYPGTANYQCNDGSACELNIKLTITWPGNSGVTESTVIYSRLASLEHFPQ